MTVKNNIFSRLMGSFFGPYIALLLNLLIALGTYFVARVVYLLENYSYFSGHLSASYLWQIFAGGWMFDRSAIVYSNIPYIVMMLFPLWLKENNIYNKVCKWVFMVANSLCFIINVADSVYFPYILRRTTTSVFQEFANEQGVVGKTILWETGKHWYLVLVAIAVIWLMAKLYVKPRLDRSRIITVKQRLAHGATMFLLLAASAPLCVGACRGGLESGVRPITISNANQYVERPIDCALVLNTPFALMRTLGKSVFQIPAYYASEEEAEKVFNPIQQLHPDHPFTKKNVVIFIVESFGREYIGALNKDLEGGRYKGYTPNVDKLIEQSCTYKYSFCNGQQSIDGMPSILCGIPRFIKPFILTPSSMNTYTGIAGLLAKEGYHTAFFHGANRGSMGFLAFSNKIGFKEYYGRQDYAADPRFGGDADFDDNWGIWDEPFLQYFCTKIGEMPQPFMTSVFTVSSHTPYIIPEKYKDVYPEEGLIMHKCIRYTDMAIGKFFEKAKTQPWFKNTIFVLTSDHTNLSDHAEYQTDMGRYCSPIVIYDPTGETVAPGMRDGIAQQIDILPTVMSILGYDKPFLSFGCDLMTTPMSETYSVCHLNDTYQYAKYGYVLQFDGEKTKAVYSLDDRLMKHNLVGKVKQQAQMERELKAIIQTYMYRMVNDKMMP